MISIDSARGSALSTIIEEDRSYREPIGRPILQLRVTRLVRPFAGVAAANVLMTSIILTMPGYFALAVIYAVGWGLAILLGVKSRYLVRKMLGGNWVAEGTWSGVLAASFLWQGVTTYFFFREEWRAILDLSVLPLCLVYVGSKIGCLQLGCCGWTRRIPLQLIEVIWTIVALLVSSLGSLPAGVAFCAFVSLHFVGWQLGKLLRPATREL